MPIFDKYKTIRDFDDYLKDSKEKGKETKRRIICQFYDYLKAQGYEIESDLYTTKFYNNNLERQLDIAKFLHEPKSIKEIVEHFKISEQTARNNLRDLEDGIEIQGSMIKLTKEKKGRKYFYSMTVHPIFLPLNLTEVYALTKYLRSKARDEDVGSQTLSYLIERIESQLSDYAFERLYPGKKKKSAPNDYVSDEEFARQREHIAMYMLKSGSKCTFYHGDDRYTGRIRMGDDGCIVKADDGSVFELGEVEWIPETLEYR